MKFFDENKFLSQNNPVYFLLLKQTVRFEKFSIHQPK